MSFQDKEHIMSEIEKKAEKLVSAAIKTSQICNPKEIICHVKQDKEKIEKSQELLLNIMKQCGNDFEKNVGRPMTYSEMRAMFG